MTTAFAVGFATAFSLILAIGAQNAFVLRQGLMRAHVFAVCLLCALSDAVLITAGVAGFGAAAHSFPALPVVLGLGGAIFLFVYGALRLRAAWLGHGGIDPEGQSAGLWPTLLTAAAFTWGNPHVYLDTFGLIGAVSAGFDSATKPAFALGAILSSFTFFFGLGYGARFLSPLMRSPRSWRVLDLGIGLLMWVLATTLLWSVLSGR